jgi:hypothetical protein
MFATDRASKIKSHPVTEAMIPLINFLNNYFFLFYIYSNFFSISYNFDIYGPLNNLQEIRGRLNQKTKEANGEAEISLLSFDREGRCRILSLDEAISVIDYVWDNAFKYNGIIQ